MKIKSEKDFLAGLLFMIAGGGFAVGSTQYKLGTAAGMGAGYFPLMLGIILVGLGVLIVAMSLGQKAQAGEKVERIGWRPLVHVIAGNLAFGVLLGGIPSVGLPSFGLIIAIYALVLIAGRASLDFRWKSSVLLATVLAVGSYLVFVQLLRLSIPVWPAFLLG